MADGRGEVSPGAALAGKRWNNLSDEERRRATAPARAARAARAAERRIERMAAERLDAAEESA